MCKLSVAVPAATTGCVVGCAWTWPRVQECVCKTSVRCLAMWVLVGRSHKPFSRLQVGTYAWPAWLHALPRRLSYGPHAA